MVGSGAMDEPLHLKREVWMALYGLGLLASFILYYFMQERIMTKSYHDDAVGTDVFFNNSLFLVLLNRIFASIAAAGVIVARKDRQQLKPGAPIFKFYVVSLSNLLATTSQYEALKWITFPTQMLFKCTKLIPVMVMSTMLNKKRYSVIDYATAVCVGLGCVAFLRSGDITSRIGEVESSWIGIALMGVNIGSDSFMTNFQEALFLGHELSTYNQMLYVNFCSATLGIAVLLYDGTLVSAFRFMLTHRAIQVDVVLLALGAVSGQFFITASIKDFGAVYFATVMTIQQMVSVIISAVIFKSHLNPNQLVSCAVVFGSLFLRGVMRTKPKDRDEAKDKSQGPKAAPLPTNDPGEDSGSGTDIELAAEGDHEGISR